MGLYSLDSFYAAIEPMEEQLSGPSGAGAGAHVLDGVAQLGMRVVLLPAVATGPRRPVR
jgi:hypothetical protein